MKFKRIVTIMLSLIMIAALTIPTFATEYELKSFSDVPASYPYYQQVMRAAELGLVNGTKDPDENGVGVFSPNGTMTRAAFVVVVIRAVAPNELVEFDNQGSGKYWYSNAAELAVDLGILERMDFDGISNADNMNKAITREEMAHILAKATNYLGLEAVNKVSTNSITDWSKVSPNYQQDVLTTYRMGMITGYGYPGNFGAKDTMTRAQACIVLNRLLDTDNRTKLPTSTNQKPSDEKPFDKNDYSSYWGYTIPGQTATAQTWKEGEKHSVPKVGDTIIAKNGTKYTIQATYTEGRCILGFGIPCDIWTGTVAPDGTVTTVANGTGWWGDDFSSMKRNTATGEVHTATEWGALTGGGLIKRPTTKGTYDGQVSGYYIWRVIDGAYGTDADWSFENRTK